MRPMAGMPLPKIVLIEPDPTHREYITAVLEDLGYEVMLANSGSEALKLAQENQLEAMIASLAKDDMEPMELASMLRGLPRQGRVILILMINPGSENTVRQAVDAGVDDYVCKPVRAEELMLRLHMGRRRRDLFWRPEEQEALLELTRLMASSLDIRELMHLVAVRTAQLLKVDRCSMVLIDENQQEGTVLAASEDYSLGGIRVKLQNYPEIIEVIESRQPFVVEKVEEHPKLKNILPHLVSKGIGSLALFPMLDDQRVSGVLFLRSERFARPLSERDIFFANAVAAAVALALRNLNLFERQCQLAAELQRTKNFLESLIQSSADAIIAADLNGKIILFNQSAEKIFGYKSEEVVGKMNVTALYPPSGAQEIMKLLRREEKDGKFLLGPIRREVINQKGEIVPIQLSAWGVMENGKLVATAGIFTDLRERLNIERQLSQAQQKLIESERQAMLAELAGAAAHELNQPLTSILGYTELARRKIDNREEVLRILGIIFSEAERMAEIVRKIGKVTRYETKSYVGSQRIMDIDRSSEPFPGGEEGESGESEK